MKSIIITANGMEHRYVMKSLIDVLDKNLCGIMIEDKTPINKKYGSIKRVYRRYTCLQLMERVFTKLVRKILKFNKRECDALKKVLGSDFITIPENVPLLRTKSVNSINNLQWIRNINPDYIFVYGTSFVNDKVLSLASVRALNLHTGLSPFYRGSDTYFWPLYNKEPFMVGATVHECTSNMDGGSIYARISVRIEEDDDPFIAFAKCVKFGALIYSKVAKCLINGQNISAEKQDMSLGREYRFVNRTFLHDLKMEYMIRSGKLKQILKDLHNKKLPFFYEDNGC